MPSAIQVRAETADWPLLRAFVEDWCAARALPQDECSTLLIMLEELHTNLVKYAYAPDGPRGSASVSLDIRDGSLILDVVDDGQPFDPLSHTASHLEFDLADRPVGGLGLHMIQQLSHAASYWHEDGRNHLRLARLLAAAPSTAR